MKPDIREEIAIPKGVDFAIQGDTVTVICQKNEIKKHLEMQGISIVKDSEKIVVSVKKASKRDKTLVYTNIARIKNFLEGVQKPYVYTMKICYSHFPMNVAVEKGRLVIKNFLGEKKPRELAIMNGVTVKVAAQDVTVESADLELAGQTASEIELLTRRKGGRDLRVFQDGIYITEKGERTS